MPVSPKQELLEGVSRVVRFLAQPSCSCPHIVPVLAAGGYDAIWVLVCDPIDCYPDQRPSERIERLWSVYSDSNVCPLMGGESAAKGTHIETLDNVPGLKEAISAKNGL